MLWLLSLLSSTCTSTHAQPCLRLNIALQDFLHGTTKYWVRFPCNTDEERTSLKNRIGKVFSNNKKVRDLGGGGGGSTPKKPSFISIFHFGFFFFFFGFFGFLLDIFEEIVLKVLKVLLHTVMLLQCEFKSYVSPFEICLT